MPTRTTLPQLSGDLFLTDGGIETSLIYQYGFDLPYFAAFDLLRDPRGLLGLREYYIPYLDLAEEHKTGFILESPTWRASPDWLEKLGYPPSALSDVNRAAIDLMVDLYEEYAGRIPSLAISGCIGPRGDGYRADVKMFVERAEKYHRAQISVFAETPVDFVTAITLNYVEEAIGITRAANSVGLPVVISFTLETDGNLPSGQPLGDAIAEVDGNADVPPAYYMINCAHPVHFVSEFEKLDRQPWMDRVHGIRANASHKTHAELDVATELDRGDLLEFGRMHTKVQSVFSNCNIYGGCCGTDDEHIREILRQRKS